MGNGRQGECEKYVIVCRAMKQLLLFVIIIGECISSLTLIAMTGGDWNAGSDDMNYLLLGLKNHERSYAPFPDNPGNDMTQNKADTWVFDIADFELSQSCIKKEDIVWVAISAGGNDRWEITWVMTLITVDGMYEVLTEDPNVDRWIYGIGDFQDFPLTIV